jgi:Putative Actinobacterial Holin-X, holin superfamily III
MPTRATEAPGIGSAATEVAERARSIARLEAKLALAELKQKLAALGVGVAAGVGAAVFGLFALGFAAATVAAAIATGLPVWLSLLIVTAGFVLLAAGAGLVCVFALTRASPPVPEQAIAEARLITAAVKSNGNR